MIRLDVHFVDFSGNLETTACGLPLTDDLEAAIDNDANDGYGLVTILPTSANCGGCRRVIDGESPVVIAPFKGHASKMVRPHGYQVGWAQ